MNFVRVTSTMLAAIFALLGVCSSSAVAADSSGAHGAELSQCIQRERQLDVVVLMDESGSLKGSDPNGTRVDGIKSLIAALASESQSSNGQKARVRVLLAGFYGGVEPNPRAGSLPWITLDGKNLDSVLAEAEEFRSRDSGRDTDYATAFFAANSYFTRVGQGVNQPCRAVIFFTDGAFDIRDRTLGGALPASPIWDSKLDLTKPGSGKKAIQAGKQYLCKRAGLIDQMRASGVQIYSIGLSSRSDDPDLDFLRSISSGDGTCGEPTTSSVGEFEIATANDLFFRFRDTVSGETPEIRSGNGEFILASGIDSLLMRAATASPGVSVKLTSPGGKSTTIGYSTGRKSVNFEGLEIDAIWPSKTTLELRGINVAPDTSTGRWLLEFEGTGDAAESRYTLEFTPDITLQMVGNPTAIRGERSTLEMTARDASGNPVKWLPTFAEVTLSGVVVDPESGRSFPVTFSEPDADGNVTASFDLARDVSAPSVNLNTEMTYAIPQSRISAVSPNSFKLTTGLPPGNGYPYVSPAAVTAPPMNGPGTSSSKTTLLGSKNRGGCVWLRSASAEAGTVKRTVLLDGKPLATTHSSCAHIAASSRHQLEIRFSTDDNEDQIARGLVELGVSSDVLPEKEAISVRATAQFLHKSDPVTTAWLTVVLTFLGIAIPVGLICLLNWFGAKLAPPAMVRQWSGTVKVDAQNGSITNEAGHEFAITLSDMTYLDGSNSDQVREIDVAPPLRIRAVANGRRGGSLIAWILSVIRGPYAVATAGSNRIVGGGVAGIANWADGTSQELPLSLAGSWLFLPQGEIGSAATDSSSVKGHLYLFVGGEQSADEVTESVVNARTGLLSVDLTAQQSPESDSKDGSGVAPRIKDFFARLRRSGDSTTGTKGTNVGPDGGAGGTGADSGDTWV